MERIKNIVILVLLVTSVLFGLKWFWGGNEASKQKLKDLTEKYKELEKQKQQVEKDIISWQEKYKAKDIEDKKKAQEILQAKLDVKNAILKANKSKQELVNYKNSLAKSKKDIEDLKKNPPKISDDELLKSLRKKLN